MIPALNVNVVLWQHQLIDGRCQFYLLTYDCLASIEFNHDGHFHLENPMSASPFMTLQGFKHAILHIAEKILPKIRCHPKCIGYIFVSNIIIDKTVNSLEKRV